MEGFVLEFIGRSVELGLLTDLLDRVTRTGAGVLLAVRGRRQVGKSRLLEEFMTGAAAPGAFFAASRGASPDAERGAFALELAGSDLAAAEGFAGVEFSSWDAAMRLLARGTTTPCVVVIDELPWLLEGDSRMEGMLQTVWDQHLSKVPILLVLIGSDLAMMERLGEYGRPLHQRARELVVPPLSIADAADALHLAAADAVDAHLLTGGFPRLLEEWSPGEAPMAFIRRQLDDATSPLLVVGERIVNAEFPPATQAHAVLATIGDGAVTFSRIRDRSGLNEGSLARSLDVLIDTKRVVRVERPLASARTNRSRYVVADPYLRFWLRYLRRGLEVVMRGRGPHLADRIASDWSSYRGIAVEALVRDSLERLLPDHRFGSAEHVGSYWTRAHDVEVDLVGGTRAQAPCDVAFLGSVKWREQAPFGRDDLLDLAAQRGRVPGAEQARLVGVSRAGFAVDGLHVALTPDDLVDAWRPGRSGDGHQK